jgi:lysophospholipase L1-like esterase
LSLTHEPIRLEPTFRFIAVLVLLALLSGGLSAKTQAKSRRAQFHSQITVTALGDSIRDTNFNPQAWPAWLAKDAPGYQVTAAGVAGDSTASLLLRLRPDGIHGGWDSPPGVHKADQRTFVLIGINDVIPYTTAQPSGHAIVANLVKIYAYLRHHHSTVYPMTILPWAGAGCFNAARERVRVFVNTWILKQLRAINMDSAVSNDGYPPRQRRSADGIHPAAIEAAAIAARVLRAR